jgi:hypothetical protein
MNTNHSPGRLEGKIVRIQEKLRALGPMHPGSVSRQYQVCGNPACRCLHPQKPQKHGPYYKLAYVHRGKPVCRFVRADSVEEVKKRLRVYKTFRTLMDRWIELSIQQGVAEFFSPAAKKTAARRASSN